MGFPWLPLICTLCMLNTILLMFNSVPHVVPPAPHQPPPVCSSCPTCSVCPAPPTCPSTTSTQLATQGSPGGSNRLPTLLVYVYSEAAGSSNSDLKVNNLKYFLKHGLCEDCPNLEIKFIINGPAKFDEFPPHKNIEVIRRDDTCAAGDFAAWDHLFNMIDRKKYKRLMFINDTVRGPYIDPIIYRLAGPHFHFTDLFSNLISDQTKMVGSYLNCGGIKGKGPNLGYSHIQTMAWMTDDVGIEVVRPAIRCYGERYEAITHGEIGMSRRMIDAGYNVGSMLLAYRGVDFRSSEQMRGYCNDQEDPTFSGKYFGQSIHPLEVVFFKNSREGGNWPIIDTYSDFFNNMGKNPV